MYLRALSHIILILLVSILDIAFISQLPAGLHHVHLLVIALIFVYLLGNVRYAVWWVLGGGMMFEVFSFNGFGWHLAALLLALGVIILLFQKVMTNRSLYSISVVAIFSVFFYDLVLLFRDYLSGEELISSWLAATGGELIGMLYNIALALLVFYLSNSLTKRLNPGFLIKHGKDL